MRQSDALSRSDTGAGRPQPQGTHRSGGRAHGLADEDLFSDLKGAYAVYLLSDIVQERMRAQVRLTKAQPTR